MIIPQYSRPDKGDGGIRRVVEAQVKHLPKYDIEIVDSISRADVVATHAAELPEIPVGKPWIVHTHGLYWSEYDWPGWGDRVNAAVIEAMKRCDHVTAPSKWVAYALQRGMWLRPTVLHHGIEPELWEPAENHGYVIWNKARVDAISDPTPMNKLAKLCPQVQFMSSFGEPANNVKIMGKKPFDEAKKDIEHAGIYLATTRETFGIGTLEAMACGVPVLGWDWAGQTEIIKHKVTGWLAPVGDYANLKEGLYWCFENRDIVGKAAREDVLSRFTWDKVMASYADLYAKALSRQQNLNSSPKVSIISPCNNLGYLLPDMVASVQDQTMSNWELIIVDDASTDDSFAVAQKLAKKDNRIQVVRSNENLKLPGALNYGFKHANGRYIMNLDPDNMIPPMTLKILSDALDNERGLHIAYGRIKFVLEDGITPDPVTGTDDGISGWPPQFSALNQIRHRNQIPSTCLARREVFERTGGYRDRAKVAEDAEFWCRAVSYGFQPRKVTEAVTYIYRYRPDSKSRDEREPDWTAWLPWSRDSKLVPWGVASPPPKETNKRAWPVPSCEPALITVIIPVGAGHEKLVMDALDSVEAQTFRAWNCIVINDTGHELNLPHPWIHLMETKGDEGPGAARNIGIAASRTEAIVCLDADDIMEPDCLEQLWNIWKREGGIVYSQWWDDKGNGDISVWNPPDWEPTLLITDGCIFATCAIYPKKLWREVGGYDPAIKYWEDWDFQIACALKGACAVKINKPLFTYRKTTGRRRETAAGSKKIGEKEMITKWPDMWNGSGKERLSMACSGCGRNKSRQVQPIRQDAPRPQGAVTMLQYIGGKPKSMWQGNITRTKYYFGNDPGHLRKWVYNEDVPGFLAMRGKFISIDPAKKEAPLPVEIKEKPVLTAVMEG